MKKSKADKVQKDILKEHMVKQKNQVPEFNPQVNQFVLSDGRVLRLTDTNCLYKKTLFKGLQYANYQINFTDELPLSRDVNFKRHAINFINFINEHKSVNTNILKEFEAFRVSQGIKPQSSGAMELRVSFRDVLFRNTFTASLTYSEIDLLTTISETKLTLGTDFEQVTLTSWFSQHTWLRREDVGVGAELYARLSSPKALVKSFNITTEISLLEIQKSKYALIKFFKKNKDALQSFRTIPKRHSAEILPKQYGSEKEKIIRANMNLLRVVYHQVFNSSEVLKNAMSLLINSFSLDFAKHDTELCFFENRKLTMVVKSENRTFNRFKSKDSSLFTLDYIYELIQYAKNETQDKCPTSKAEHQLFQWMMASLCIQPSDIPKLRLCDFKMLKKGNGSVVSIESEYFKGRSKVYHVTEGIKGSSNKGQVLVNFIADVTANFNDKYRYEALSFIISKIMVSARDRGDSNLLISLADTYIYQSIKDEHLKKMVADLIINSLNKLCEFGVCYKGYEKEKKLKKKLKQRPDSREAFLRKAETPLQTCLFSLTHIKNSSVHTKSEFFDPTQLLNYRSHTNGTERKSYFTPANGEWENNCGLITRAIMQDIYSNVYRLSDSEETSFKSEFINAREAIEQRKNDTLVRLKLITGTDGEVVNELGITKVKEVNFFLNDAIYIIDSGETVMKLKHYISEAETHCHTLLESNPIFLFNTVLPTVEWIESLFSEAKFSKKSLEKGRDLFDKYADILPPIFKSHETQ